MLDITIGGFFGFLNNNTEEEDFLAPPGTSGAGCIKARR